MRRLGNVGMFQQLHLNHLFLHPIFLTQICLGLIVIEVNFKKILYTENIP